MDKSNELKTMFRKMNIHLGIFLIGYALLVFSTHPAMYNLGFFASVAGCVGYIVTPNIHAIKNPDFSY